MLPYIEKRKRMNHIVLDLEWNQAAHPARAVTVPLRLNGEIVQMGAVKLNERFEAVDEFKAMIRPRFYKTMHHKVKELTGITAEELAGGCGFAEAMERFFAWCGEDWDLFTWGPDDEGVLRDNCIVFGVDRRPLPPCCNLQLIFDDQITGEKRQFSLSFAMEKVGESLSDAHDALSDAKGTALLCRHLDMERGLRDYPALYNQVTPPSLFTLSASRLYPSKRSALKDPQLQSLCHPALEGVLSLGDWVSASQWKYTALGQDEGGKRYFVSLKFVRKDGGKLAVSRTVHPLNEKLRRLHETKAQAAV